MDYDVSAVRARIPALAEGAAHFDAPGGTQTPDVVARAVADVLTSAVANRGHATAAERRAEAIVGDFRRTLGAFLGVDPRGVVHGRSMTQLTYDVARTLSKTWGRSDEIVVTSLEHDADHRPWVQAARAVGAQVRVAEFDPATGELSPDAISAHLSSRTRLVAVTAASNLIGTRPDLPEIARRVHAANEEALLFVDGVHASAHGPVDVPALGADLYACSPYKFLGPHCGVLAADPALLDRLHPDKLAPSTDAVPERLELGTLPYEILAGCSATVRFLATLGEKDPGLVGEVADADDPGRLRERIVASARVVEEHEDRLRRRIEEGLARIPDVTVWSRARHRTPTLLFRLEGVPDEVVRDHLAGVGVNAPCGSFYALECSRRLGLGDTGALRVGLAPYNDEGDVDRLLEGLADVRASGKPGKH